MPTTRNAAKGKMPPAVAGRKRSAGPIEPDESGPGDRSALLQRPEPVSPPPASPSGDQEPGAAKAASSTTVTPGEKRSAKKRKTNAAGAASSNQGASVTTNPVAPTGTSIPSNQAQAQSNNASHHSNATALPSWVMSDKEQARIRALGTVPFNKVDKGDVRPSQVGNQKKPKGAQQGAVQPENMPPPPVIDISDDEKTRVPKRSDVEHQAPSPHKLERQAAIHQKFQQDLATKGGTHPGGYFYTAPPGTPQRASPVGSSSSEVWSIESHQAALYGPPDKP